MEKRFVIKYNGKTLSYLHPNGNGTVKDIIGFSNKSYHVFEDEGGAWDYLQTMHDKIIERKDELTAGLFDKLEKVINSCKVADRTPYSVTFEDTTDGGAHL
ncbi:MAG: hypothetical protein WC332_00405 [Clostridia bacterium]|jgi:hypothetical protein